MKKFISKITSVCLICSTFLLIGCNFHSNRIIPEDKKIENNKTDNIQKFKENTAKSTNQELKNNKLPQQPIKKKLEENKDSDIIIQQVNSYADAINKSNEFNISCCLNPFIRDYEDKKTFFNVLFQHYNIQYTINKIDIKTLDKEAAIIIVNVTSNGFPKENSEFKNGTYNVQITLNKLEGGIWKISSQKIVN